MQRLELVQSILILQLVSAGSYRSVKSRKLRTFGTMKGYTDNPLLYAIPPLPSVHQAGRQLEVGVRTCLIKLVHQNGVCLISQVV